MLILVLQFKHIIYQVVVFQFVIFSFNIYNIALISLSALFSISSRISILVEPSYYAPILTGCVLVRMNCFTDGVDLDYNSADCLAEDLYAFLHYGFIDYPNHSL